MVELRDEFLSEEDLDLANLSDQELDAWWNLWLRQAQITNEEDANSYSHGVFVLLGGSGRAAFLSTEERQSRGGISGRAKEQ
jgi:hypothetical protein